MMIGWKATVGPTVENCCLYNQKPTVAKSANHMPMGHQWNIIWEAMTGKWGWGGGLWLEAKSIPPMKHTFKNNVGLKLIVNEL